AMEKITILSETDDLTQISNRRHIESIVKKEILQYNLLDKNEKLSIAIIDIDRFKYINDYYGHLKGDEILIKFSDILSNNLKQNDAIGRWGGDEFLIMLPDINIIDANALMEELLRLITETDFGIDFPLTFSYGVEEYDPSLDYNQFFKVIDHLLYSYKRHKTDIQS
ncbi:MAG: GGDEF domain-containing protein, partial [Firmicutes bacterium]|nr:GGDEF domain-containing protein [Bacillota bacterium]